MHTRARTHMCMHMWSPTHPLLTRPGFHDSFPAIQSKTAVRESARPSCLHSNLYLCLSLHPYLNPYLHASHLCP